MYNTIWLAAQERAPTLDSYFHKYRQGEIKEQHFVRQLLSTANQSSEARDSIRLLEKYQPHISQPGNGAQITHAVARNYELLGDYQNAINAYRRYATEMKDNQVEYYQTHIRIAHLYLELGQIPQAYSLTLQILQFAPTDLQHLATILLARIERARGELISAKERLKLLIKRYPSSPYIRMAYVALYEIQTIAGDTRDAAKTQAEMTQRYPRSIEAELVRNAHDERPQIIPIPSSDRIFGGHDHDHHRASHTPVNAVVDDNPTLQSLTIIQVGSFIEHKNALGLQARLQKENYTTKVINTTVNGRNYHQVRIYVPNGKAERALAQLRAQSINGFVISE